MGQRAGRNRLCRVRRTSLQVNIDGLVDASVGASRADGPDELLVAQRDLHVDFLWAWSGVDWNLQPCTADQPRSHHLLVPDDSLQLVAGAFSVRTTGMVVAKSHVLASATVQANGTSGFLS